ncbi:MULTISPECIES: hypothetical protein [Streptomyces]|uniref:Uncharacterized protein n=1 Tax=Streptomyces koelreuteriae TaxID=2838015 RepID=A0ABX8FX14_9ACTN|nr:MULTISPECIES: hypothetical protein [Streptomyces]QWB25608.1 hypothetical protein KJK29_25260 [Streptomyces koelreuteriae]UUA08657.1 hypothetical protein NNW98_25415 [Streptomyces koelreuteriae]UUA16262.1 hypothetical protein NNW99_25300 [Streptomyces sp. CRCS-T-1]
MQLPEDQIRAGHIPADLYRQIPPGTNVRKIVIVQEAPRSYKGPIVMTLLITTGSVVVLLVLAFVVQVIAASIVTVLSATCGITYTLNRVSKHPARSRPRRTKNRRFK